MTNAAVQHEVSRAIRSDLWDRMDTALAPLSPWDPDFELVITLDTALTGLFFVYRLTPTIYTEALNAYLLEVGA